VGPPSGIQARSVAPPSCCLFLPALDSRHVQTCRGNFWLFHSQDSPSTSRDMSVSPEQIPSPGIGAARRDSRPVVPFGDFWPRSSRRFVNGSTVCLETFLGTEGSAWPCNGPSSPPGACQQDSSDDDISVGESGRNGVERALVAARSQKARQGTQIDRQMHMPDVVPIYWSKHDPVEAPSTVEEAPSRRV
jgi:hypothetical protein